MNVSVITLGCKANQAESSLIECALRSMGINITSRDENSDFCIINTCTVTAKSDYQSRQEIRRAVRSGAAVIVTGCYSELHKKEIEAMQDGVKLFDNKNKLNIINLFDDNASDSTLNNKLSFQHSEKSRYFLKIQDGCDNKCTYCVIPSVRGNSVSSDPLVILEQVQEISKHFSELVLSGIHLGAYGYDLTPQFTLSKLLKLLLARTTISRIRLSSLEINEIDSELIELIKSKRICDHLHIPLQSGDDRILSRMGRKYTQREYHTKIFEILSNFPDISIGTDIIAGFPGETDECFENTFRFVELLPFSYIHVFPYSQRPNTPAYLYVDTVAQGIKNQRSSRLRALGRHKKCAYMMKQAGNVLDCLIEKEVNESSYSGISNNYLKMRFEGRRMNLKSIVPLRVVSYDSDNLIGFPIS